MAQTQEIDFPNDTNSGQTGFLWRIYFIISIFLIVSITVVGGIIWHNFNNASELVIETAERLILERDEKIIDRLKSLYDPIYTIVAAASQAPELTSPSVKNDPNAKAIFLRALRIYPQLRSVYVGFDNGEFFMFTHIAGDDAGNRLRARLGAPLEAVFANEIVDADAAGELKTRWIFLADDGHVVGQRDTAPAFDPRSRPWYEAAKRSKAVERSNLYIFASSGDPGITLSRSFTGAKAGVMGADIALTDLDQFLRDKNITKTSTAFIFTAAGNVIVAPNLPKSNISEPDSDIPAASTKVSDMHDPVIDGLISAYEKDLSLGAKTYNVAGRTYTGHVSEIDPRYGPSELLAIMVPVDEFLDPFLELRNKTLFYALGFLVFAFPICVILVRRLIMGHRQLVRLRLRR